jgi:hypothetical protein
MKIVGLKTCPFCNTEPEIHVYGDSYGSRTYYGISCPKCKTATTGSDDQSLEGAVSRWNTRDGNEFNAILLTILSSGNFYASVTTDKNKLKFHRATKKLPHPNEKIFIFNEKKTDSKDSKLIDITVPINIKCWAKSGQVSTDGPIGYNFKDYPFWIKREDVPEMKLMKGSLVPTSFETLTYK